LAGEQELRGRFARIGIEAGKPWPPAGLSPEVVAAIEDGRQEARKALEERLLRTTTSVGLFGTPQEMAGKYTERAIGAMGGIYGNSTEETVYPSYLTDETGQRFDTGKSRYILRFGPDELPPVNAFWSVTMYDAEGFQAANEINRFALGDRDPLTYNPDGSLDLYIQHKRPDDPARQPNWLPAPTGPLGITMRLYAPKRQVLDGRWQPPVIRRAG
jgi:hypothetical protein